MTYKMAFFKRLHDGDYITDAHYKIAGIVHGGRAWITKTVHGRYKTATTCEVRGEWTALACKPEYFRRFVVDPNEHPVSCIECLVRLS